MANFARPSFGAATDTWKSLLSQGDLCETKHQHRKAIETFDQAANFAERNKLPSKCLELALCRQAAVEVQANAIASANEHCDKLMTLVAREKATNTLDPDLEVWILNLANAYQANLTPLTREQCLIKLCAINKTLYGDNHKDYKSARAALADYYRQTQPQKAAKLEESFSNDALLQVQKNSDPMAQGYILNQLALNSRMHGDLEKARAADLQLLKLAKTSPQVADGTAVYYASLGTIELAKGKVAESKNYFTRARLEGSKIKGNKNKEMLASISLATLISKVKSDRNPRYPHLAGDELTELLSVQQTISADPIAQFNLNRILADVLQDEKRFVDCDKNMARAIEIAKHSIVKDNCSVPALYTRWATFLAHRGQSAKSNDLFAKALASEPNKKGFGAIVVLINWGDAASKRADFHLSQEKFDLAIKQATNLPPQTRGTLLLDSLAGLLAALQKNGGNENSINKLKTALSAEQGLQRKLNTGLGPNFFHML